MLLYWLVLLMATLTPSETRTIMDLSDSRAAASWSVVDDGVMGGVSASRWLWSAEGYGIFSGDVSLENNGGFCSLRTVLPSVDASGYVGVEWVIRGDGKRYSLNVSNATRGIFYSYDVETTGDWQTVRLPFAALVPERFGVRVPNAPALDIRHLLMFNVIISDKQQGGFSLFLQRVSLYR